MCYSLSLEYSLGREIPPNPHCPEKFIFYPQLIP